MPSRSLVLLSALLICSCAPMTAEQQQQFQQTLAAFAEAVQPAPATKFMVFGGEDHKTYLGCLNCDQGAQDSVLNGYGENGSPYSATSLANRYGDFGSPYSMYSACNPYATDPPVIVDGAGNFYGRLTINAYNTERTQDQTVLTWVAAICAH